MVFSDSHNNSKINNAYLIFFFPKTSIDWILFLRRVKNNSFSTLLIHLTIQPVVTHHQYMVDLDRFNRDYNNLKFNIDLF